MLENTGILVAGLSGGADSVCLVAVLKEIIEKWRKKRRYFLKSGTSSA